MQCDYIASRTNRAECIFTEYAHKNSGDGSYTFSGGSLTLYTQLMLANKSRPMNVTRQPKVRTYRVEALAVHPIAS